MVSGRHGLELFYILCDLPNLLFRYCHRCFDSILEVLFCGFEAAWDLLAMGSGVVWCQVG